MAPEAAIGEADNRHAGAEGDAQAERKGHAHDAAVGNPDIAAEGFEGVERAVEVDGGGHGVSFFQVALDGAT